MSAEEKNTWAFGLIALLSYATYVTVLLAQAAGAPLTEAEYVTPMLYSIGGAVLAGIIAGIVFGATAGKGQPRKDQRDKQIYRFGEYAGQGFLIGGAIVALILAIMQANYFWIANVIYLAFVLAAIVSSVARLVAYRRGFTS
ncbi:hypothetical protein [Lysinibacter cavernae]|uniref:Putative membrane channel-forming protein YqfA (Hemolysin III family) n=1 Tax=Lysinibacter cavernae TaxID=1640652 RepID=A0A7X5R072_9MICO|nr:hypothetical protein [Lysinibacter cavernae]NIH53250.1 putative membrane channel-forming protein YqfA (hemolysin III family) [Lysinibacter cavernae]